jgi:polyhydroxyalkanoate synthesis regulator phasin
MMPQSKKQGSGSARGADGGKGSRSHGRSASPKSRSAGGRSGGGGQRVSQRRSQQAATDDVRTSVTALSEFLVRGMDGPLHLVMLTNDRIQEVMDDAVERGRMTRDDAEELVQEMVNRGRQQTTDLLADLEQLVDRGRGQLETAATAARRATPPDRVRREVDRARRAAGLGQAFPILSYEDLTAAQVSDRLEDLTPAELRKVRDFERRHGNRKSVLQAIEAKLS